MTNKLPVVGKRYTNKITGTIYKAFKHKARENCYFMESQSKAPDLIASLDDFWTEFEELPEDKAETINCGNISCEYKSECDSSRRILPKIDQIYIKKTRYARITNVDSEGVTYLEQDGKEFWDCFKDFLDFFEPAEAETKPETQSHISELSPEVKKAIEELDKELDRWMPTEDKEEYQLTSKAEKLLNALNEQFMSKEEVKIDTRQERVDSIKVNETSESVDVKEEEVKEKESIWKPVNELPTNNAHCLVKCNDANKNHVFSAVFLAKEQAKGNKGFVDLAAQHLGGMNYSEEYVTLTDIINDYEKLKERVKKLEETCRKS